jgi:hypothetical protein
VPISRLNWRQNCRCAVLALNKPEITAFSQVFRYGIENNFKGERADWDVRVKGNASNVELKIDCHGWREESLSAFA